MTTLLMLPPSHLSSISEPALRHKRSGAEASDRWAGLALAICFLGTLQSAWLSDGVYHEDDLTHYLFARWVGHDARYLLDPWGRPGFTVLYCLPAMIGEPAAGLLAGRLVSVVLSAATAWLTYLTARQLRLRHAWLAIPLLYAQPLFTHLSFTTLTETPLALYFALATWLLLTARPPTLKRGDRVAEASPRGRWRVTASAIVIGLAPVTRDEAVVVLPLWAIAMWRMRAAWWDYLLLGWAVAAHNLLGAVFLTDAPIQRWLQTGGANPYGRGTALTYIPHLLTVAGPVVAALAIMGGRRVLSRRGGWLLAAAAGIYFLTETVIYMQGAFVSGGYARFLVPITPWLAVLATGGVGPLLLRRRADLRLRALRTCGLTIVALWVICEIEWWWRGIAIRPEWRHWMIAGRIMAGGVAALTVLAVMNLASTRPGRLAGMARTWLRGTAFVLLVVGSAAAMIPMRIKPQQWAMRDAVIPLGSPVWRQRVVLSMNPWVFFWSDRWMPQSHRRWYELLDQARPGTLFAWDNRFCAEAYPDLAFERMCVRPGWEIIWAAGRPQNSREPFLALFERRSPVEVAAPALKAAPTSKAALIE